MNKILNLTLYKSAFEVMVTGEKRFEFRKPGKWINSRLFNKDGSKKGYDLIKFTNGYGNDKPYFVCKYLGFGYEYGLFKYSNGLEIDVSNDFAIKCGEIVEIGNYILKNEFMENVTSLPIVPFRAKDKTNNAYSTIVVKKIIDNSVVAHTIFADGYRKFERKISINDIELIPEHICNPDSFNKHCQICGKYCG